eukprot:3201085-Lingulodinium_polyedra.AAC.1
MVAKGGWTGGWVGNGKGDLKGWPGKGQYQPLGGKAAPKGGFKGSCWICGEQGRSSRNCPKGKGKGKGNSQG